MRAAQRWLVVRPGALGDAVLTLPALAALVRSGGRVTVVGDRGSWGFLRQDDRVSVADIESRAWRGLFADQGFTEPGPEGYRDAILYLGSGRERAERALAQAGAGDRCVELANAA